MYHHKLYLVFLFSYISCQMPDYVTVCRKSDPKFSECLLQNANEVIRQLAQHGEPSLEIPTIRTTTIPKIAMHASPELAVLLTDWKTLGLALTKILNITMTDNELSFKAHLPRLWLSGRYSFHGKLLMLSINSSGPMNMTQDAVDFEYKAMLFTKERHGKNFYYVGSEPGQTRTTITNIQHSSFEIDNLFPADPRISIEMNALLNENWKDVYYEIQEAMGNAYSWFLVNPIVNGFLTHIPIDDLVNL